MMNDKILSNVVAFVLIITMGFVCMIFMDLDSIWKEILNYKQRIRNLETLILIHHNDMGKIGCSI
jgi:hypothetical protein|tara:strand:- start:106 stop:300 length:195 start_codon:yes stop_codon:yes gene_type:complete